MPATTSHRSRVLQGDCLEVLAKRDAASIDAVVTDPPYGISMAGMRWDTPRRLDPSRPLGRRSRANPSLAFQGFCTAWGSECLRVLKPGGHLVSFAAPRTAHLLAYGLEAAGFELRDTLMWLQGQGYPHSRQLPGGWGTGLKPAHEPILLARAPLDGSLGHTLSVHGTGGLNIDGCRLPDPGVCDRRTHTRGLSASQPGRWPANVVLSHTSQCTTGRCRSNCPASLLGDRHRFFYCAKASRRERDAGCEQLPRQVVQTFKIGARYKQMADENPVANIHPTVKPIELMRWLVRLVTPQGGLVLDPFAGSGSTGAAAQLEGARFLGIEQDSEYVRIARARIKHWAMIARTEARVSAACTGAARR
jgi:DNA modification methylase